MGHVKNNEAGILPVKSKLYGIEAISQSGPKLSHYFSPTDHCPLIYDETTHFTWFSF